MAEEGERFSMDGEFDGIGRGPKLPRRLTKAEQVYGMFADDDEVRDQRDAFKNKNKNAHGSVMAKQVKFKSAGTIDANLGAKDKKDDEHKVRKSRGGLDKRKRKDEKDKKDAVAKLPVSFGTTRRTQEEQIAHHASLKRSDRQPVQSVDKGFAGFEKHGKGIGSKLLEKMGWTAGQGLGKNGGGVTKALEVKVRQKGQALQDTGEMVASNKEQIKRIQKKSKPDGTPLSEESESESDSESEEESQPKIDRTQNWKKQKKGPKPVKAQYKTAAEVAQGSRDAPQKQKIVDMRGPQARVLVSLDGLDQRSSGSCPELRANIRCLVEEAEYDIQNSRRKLNQFEETTASLGRQRDQMTSRMHSQSKQLKSVGHLLAQIAKCSQKPPLELPQLSDLFQLLRKQFPQEYRLFRLFRLAVPVVLPKIRAAMREYDPLGPQAASELKKVLAPVAALLVQSDSGMDEEAEQLVGLLLSDAIWPALRRPLTNSWDPKVPQPVVSVFRVLKQLVPAELLESSVDQLIWPRLRSLVDDWNPTKDTVRIDQWLLPWLDVAGLERLKVVFPTIRHKLSTALELWHPSDSSALALIAPWKKVFETENMNALLQRCIVPKLTMALTEMVIDPAHQNIEPFQWVMAWKPLLPANAMIQMMLLHFFPKWLEALFRWLSNPKADYDQVTRWYFGWKELFPPELAAHPSVKKQLAVALDLMNQVIAGQPLASIEAGLKENIRQLRESGGRVLRAADPATSGGAASSNLTFKEVVENLACEHDFVLMPRRRQNMAGKDIYSFGPLSVVLDDCVVLVLNEEDWDPISLEDLVIKAKKPKQQK